MDYAQPGASNRLAMHRVARLDLVLREIPSFAGLDIIATGVRVSHSGAADLIRSALDRLTPSRVSAPLTYRRVELSFQDLHGVLDAVRARREQLLLSGVELHFVGIDIPSNRVIMRVGRGASQLKPLMSDVGNGLVVIEQSGKPFKRLRSRIGEHNDGT